MKYTFDVCDVNSGINAAERVTELEAQVARLEAANAVLVQAEANLGARVVRLQRENASVYDTIASMDRTSAALSNALVHQKDAIYAKINAGEYTEALYLLSFLAPAWRAAEYQYKTNELVYIVRQNAREDMRVLEDRQWQRKRKLEAVIALCDQVAEQARAIAKAS